MEDGKNLDPLPELRAALADRYRFVRELGRGGMAAVSRAWAVADTARAGYLRTL